MYININRFSTSAIPQITGYREYLVYDQYRGIPLLSPYNLVPASPISYILFYLELHRTFKPVSNTLESRRTKLLILQLTDLMYSRVSVPNTLMFFISYTERIIF